MKRRFALILLIAATMLLTVGCGEEMIELTEEEHNQIVQFSAHIISEFNKNQTEGYTPLDKKQLDKIYHPKKEEPEQNVIDDNKEPENSSSETDRQPNSNSEPVQSISLTQLVGNDAIEAKYKGFKVCKDYVQSDVFAMSAGTTKRYVVVSIDLMNQSDRSVDVDMLSKDFSVSISAGGNEVKALVTILPNDFTTYEGTIAAGKTKETVMLFELPKNDAEKLENLSLTVVESGKKSQIIIN